MIFFYDVAVDFEYTFQQPLPLTNSQRKLHILLAMKN